MLACFQTRPGTRVFLPKQDSLGIHGYSWVFIIYSFLGIHLDIHGYFYPSRTLWVFMGIHYTFILGYSIVFLPKQDSLVVALEPDSTILKTEWDRELCRFILVAATALCWRAVRSTEYMSEGSSMSTICGKLEEVRQAIIFIINFH